MRCWFIRRDLTALVDGELSASRVAAVRRHLTDCAECTQLHRAIEAAVAKQHQLMPLAFGATEEVTSSALLRRVHERLDDDEPVARRWFLQPATVGTVAVVAAIIATFVGVLDPVFIAVGFEEPPEVVAEQPELFRDYAFFERIEALEHFDDVNAVQLGKPVTDQPQG
jgi:anti-sigma factor RsiW